MKAPKEFSRVVNRKRYDVVTLSQWQGEQDTLKPIDLEEAIELYEGPLTEHYVAYEAAFPGVAVEEG